MLEERRNRHAALLITLIIISLLLMTFYSRESEDGLLHRMQRFSADLVSPVQKVVSTLVSPVRGGIEFLSDLGRARAERDELREKLEELEGEVRRLNEVERENRQLREMIRVKESRPDLQLMAVRVIGSNPDLWEKTLIIGAGYSDGLREYMAVLSEDGSLVGRIVMCTAETSMVQLITDEKSSVGAMLERNAEMGVVKGDGTGIRLELLNQNADVRTGDLVLTSGLGGTCPSGIPIGTIREISERRPDLSVGIVLDPRAAFSRLERVMVVLSPLPAEMPEKREG
jgi:rod shape-determining protein MreC